MALLLKLATFSLVHTAFAEALFMPRRASAAASLASDYDYGIHIALTMLCFAAFALPADSSRMVYVTLIIIAMLQVQQLTFDWHPVTKDDSFYLDVLKIDTSFALATLMFALCSYVMGSKDARPPEWLRSCCLCCPRDEPEEACEQPASDSSIEVEIGLNESTGIGFRAALRKETVSPSLDPDQIKQKEKMAALTAWLDSVDCGDDADGFGLNGIYTIEDLVESKLTMVDLKDDIKMQGIIRRKRFLESLEQLTLRHARKKQCEANQKQLEESSGVASCQEKLFGGPARDASAAELNKVFWTTAANNMDRFCFFGFPLAYAIAICWVKYA